MQWGALVPALGVHLGAPPGRKPHPHLHPALLCREGTLTGGGAYPDCSCARRQLPPSPWVHVGPSPSPHNLYYGYSRSILMGWCLSQRSCAGHGPFLQILGMRSSALVSHHVFVLFCLKQGLKESILDMILIISHSSTASLSFI